MSEFKQALPETGPYVERLVRIFRDRPDDDGSAVVLQDYARSSLASAAVAEREPVAFTSDVALEMMRDHWQKINVIGASRFASPINNIPLYLDPPPVSELEAENARLRLAYNTVTSAAHIAATRAEAAEARVAELESANDKIEIENGLTSDGSLWRWWSKKCREVASKNTKLEARLAEALKALEQAATWLRGGDYDTRGGLIEMDRLASVCEATPPAPKVTEEEWREIEQAFQPRIRDGYTDVKVSKPGFWFVKGPGPAAAQEAGKP